eukprot:1465559-Pyramimonas_sp.AAC.1
MANGASPPRRHHFQGAFCGLFAQGCIRFALHRHPHKAGRRRIGPRYRPCTFGRALGDVHQCIEQCSLDLALGDAQDI